MSASRSSDVEIRKTPSGVEYVRTPDDRFADLPGFPFDPHYVVVDGLRMHYVDEGPADGAVVLLLHGQPTWSYLYRKMIPVLADAGLRVVAPDLIGMGRSDKPVSLEIHTFEQQVRWMARFITSLSLHEITLFGQDWGSIIGLRTVGDHPDWFARVMIANGDLPDIPAGANPLPKPDRARVEFDPDKHFDLGEVKRAIAVNPIAGFVEWTDYALRNPSFSAGQVVDLNTVEALSSEEQAAYDAPFPAPIFMAGPRTLPCMAAGISGENAPAWKALEAFDRPFLTIYGEEDPLLGGEATQQGLVRRIPGAQGQPHERVRADHFIQEDCGPLLAQRMVAWMADGAR